MDEDANQKGVYVATFTAKRTTPPDPNQNYDYTWSNSVWQRLELFDAKGNKYFCYGPTTQNNNGGTSVQMTVQFGPNDRRTGQPGPIKLGPPVKFVMNDWITINQEVNFEFKGIPLP